MTVKKMPLILKIISIFLLLIISVLFTTCEVFTPGLGEEIDKTVPAVGIESHSNGAYVGGTINLTGYATDDLEIKSVVITNSSGQVSAAIDGESWSLSYDTTQFNDGDHEVTVTATDKFDKTAQVKVLLIVDNSPPSVLVTTPSEYGIDQEFNKSITIKGEAADTTRVKSVSVSLYRSSDDVLVVDNVLATGTSSWYYIFDSSEFHGDALPSAEYYFFIKAEDYSGNINSYFYHFEDILNISIDPSSTPNIEEIKDSDFRGIAISGLSATLESIRRTVTSGSRMDISINPNSDKPQFTLISPADGSTVPSDNIFSNPQNLTGFVSDDDIAGINSATLTLTITDWATGLVVGTPAVFGVDLALLFSGSQWSYNSILPDGEYGIQLEAEDASGELGQSSPVPFKVSSSAPVISLDTPQQGVYIGKNGTTTVGVSVTGSVADEVYIDLNGDLVYDDPGEKMTPLGSGQYDFDVIPGTNITLANGDDAFQIRAGVDPNYGTFTLQYVGDIDDPTVGLSYPAEAQDVNGVINISGTAADNFLVKDVYVWIGTETDPALLPIDFSDPGWIVPTGKYNWTINNFDTNSLTDNTSYTIFVKAFDEAGNESDLTAAESSISVTVNQESDRPVISLSNMSEGLHANGLAQDASIIGLIEDDDTVDVSTLEVRVDLNNDGIFTGIDLTGSNGTLDANESEQWVPIIPGATAADDVRIFSWVHNLLNVPQGTHSMQIRVHDTNSGGVADEGLNSHYAELLETTFTIDYGPPDLVISSPANGSIFNADFVISGTAADPNGVTAIEISFDAGTTYAPIDSMTPAGGGASVTWSHNFAVDEAGGTTDGDYSYQIRATDSSGGKSTLDRQFVVDATAPTIVIDLPPAAASVNGTIVPVQGTANDNRGVTNVYIDINPDGTPPPADLASWNTTTGNYSWSYSFDSTLLNNTVIAGDFVISMKAVDEAGNESIEYTRTVSVDQTSDRPVISFNDIDKTKTVATDNVLVGATSLTGIIEDDDLIDPALFGGDGGAIEINLDNAGWEPVSQPPAAGGKLVVWKHDFPVGILEGEHSVKLRVRDNLSDGTKGASSASAEYSTDFNWNIEDSTDLGGIPFILNLGPPSITIDNPAQFSFHNTDVVIDGGAADANDVASMDISFDNGITWTDLGITAGSPVSWTYTLPVATGDGTYSYLVRATDTYGATTVENSQFTIDATIPTATINQPANGETVNGTITISGIAGDNIDLDQTYYRIDQSAAGVPAFPTGYTLAGDYSWNDTIDTTAPAYPDDTYTLRVVSVDNAANESIVTFVNFTVDQNSDKPVLSFSSILEAGTFVQNLIPASKQVAGTITDDDGVDASTIQYRLYDEAATLDVNGSLLTGALITDWTAISGAPGSDTTLATWTHTFGAGVTDGKYQMKLRAADVNAGAVYNAGEFDWNESALVKFAVDTANPDSTVTTPAANGGYTNQTFTVDGTASDANGIKSVDIQFGAFAPVNLYQDLVEPYNNSQAWTTDFTVDTAGHTHDGLLNYTITITDSYDKVKTIDRYITIDTQDPVINALTLVNNDAGTPVMVNGSVLVQGQPLDNETLVNAIYVRTEENATIVTDPVGDPTLSGWTLLGSTTNINHRFDTTLLTDATAHTTYLIVEDLAGNRTAFNDFTLSFTTNEIGNVPAISIDTADNSLLSTVDSVRGSISDDDGVDVSTIEIRFDANNDGDYLDGGAENWTVVTSHSASDSTNVVFSHSLGTGNTDQQINPYTLQVRASDIGETFASEPAQNIDPEPATIASISITVDDSDPVVVITGISNDNEVTFVPTLQGLYINDQFTITGTATDGVQVSTVRAMLAGDSGGFATVTDTDTDTDPATPFDTWKWVYGGDALASAGSSIVMNLEVEDIHGKVTPYSYTLLVDKTAPTISLNNGDTNPSTVTGAYNGTVVFTGTSADLNQISNSYYRFDAGSVPATTDPAGDGWTPVNGTYNWNFSRDTTGDNNTAVDSTMNLSVVSVDSAGNVSTEDSITFTINQGSDNPVLSITQPVNLGLIESNKKVIGSLSDDDGLASLQIRIDRNNDGDFLDTDEGYVNVSQPAAVSGTNINFEHDLSALADGSYNIQMQAVDTVNAGIYNTTASSVISFDIDTVAPALTLDKLTVQDRYGGADTVINSNFNGSYVNNDSTLEFTATDTSGVTSVDFSINGGAFGSSDTVAPYTYSLVVGGLPEGTNTIGYRATDDHGKTTTKILTIIVDTVEPVIDFSNPTGVIKYATADPVADPPVDDAPNVNGDVTVRGSVSDSSSISSVSLTGGKTAFALTNTGNTISWITSITSSGDYADTDDSYNTGDNGGTTGTAWNGTIDGDEVQTNIWRFPVEVTAQDLAGNITATTGYVDIDPDSDNPVVSVVSPANDASVSGTFLVNGTITDDDGTDYVTLEFDLDDDGVYDGTGNITVNGSAVNETTATQLTAPNGSWSVALNASEFTAAILGAAGYTPAVDGFIRMRITPYDTNGLDGAPQTVRIYLDTTQPVISNISPAGGSFQNGIINLNARFEDDKQILNSSMLISFDGGTSFEQITDQTGYSITPSGTGPYLYDIVIPVNSTTAIAGGNGLLDIQLSVTDQTNKQKSESVNYSVDNTLPTIHWNEDGSGVLQDLPFIGTPPDEIYTYKGNAGTLAADDAFKVLGAAIDTGTISGIEKINVFFVKGSNFWSPEDNTSTPTGVNTFDISFEGGATDNISFPYADINTVNAFGDTNKFLITINNRIEQGTFDQVDIGTVGDGDGFQESLKAKSGYDEWYAFFDTLQLPDGPITIYAIVYDDAGNMSYTLADAQIANNPPSFTQIKVGTSAGSATPYSGLFKVTNSLYIDLDATDVEGINTSTYKVKLIRKVVAPNGATSTDGPALNTEWIPDTDGIYTIDVQEDPATAFDSGVQYTLQMEVQDTDGNIVTSEVDFWLDNNDSTLPKVDIDDFTQAHLSGLSGHLEEDGSSLIDGTDADISGTIKITGTAWDDNALDSVELSVDGGVTWFDVTNLNPGTPDPILGTYYTWDYTWNTTNDLLGVTEDAGYNRTIQIRGTDGSLNVGVLADGSVDPTISVDIVPYITEIQTGLDNTLLKPARRSVRGWYPVTVGQEINIIGYNLPTTLIDSVDVGSTTTGLTPSVATGTSLTLNLGTTDTSGHVVVTTDGVASINHLNDNVLAQNQEDNDYNDTLTDDRYLAFFDLNTTSYSGIDAIMRPQQPAGTRNGSFDWFYVQNNVDVYYNNNKLAYSFKVNGGDFTFNSSGTPVYLFMNDSNSVDDIADQQYYFFGSVLWGLGNTAYNGLASGYYGMNWNVDLYPTLGVGNLSFNTGTNYTSATYTDSQKMSRYENLRILTSGSDADMYNYVFYFDNHPDTRSIAYFSYRTGTTATIGGAMGDYGGSTWYTELDELNDTDNVFKYNNGGNKTGIETPEGRTNLTAGSADSAHFAPYLDSLDADGTMHLVYWDESVNKIYYTYNNTPYADPNTGNLVTPRTGVSTGWTTPILIDSNAGMYPDIIVDQTGKVHITYQDSANSTLKYAYLTSKTDTVPDLSHVDGLFGAGAYNSITLKEDFNLNADEDADYGDPGESENVQRPVITTFAGGLSGTDYAVKIAFPLADPGSITSGFDPVSFTYEGTWEVMVVPSTARPSSDSTFAETDGTVFGTGQIVAGYNGSTLQSAVLRAIP